MSLLEIERKNRRHSSKNRPACTLATIYDLKNKRPEKNTENAYIHISHKEYATGTM